MVDSKSTIVFLCVSSFSVSCDFRVATAAFIVLSLDEFRDANVFSCDDSSFVSDSTFWACLFSFAEI